MPVITPDLYDPAAGFAAVRWGQGTPLADADLNLESRLRQEEARLILRDVVGDGEPAGSDAFRIVGTGAAGDFDIRRGPPGPTQGLALAGGHVARQTADFAFAAQPLHQSQPGAAALAARLAAPVIAPLETPAADGDVTAYLDVWEALVTAADEPALVLPGLGVESSARLRVQVAVRVRPGVGAPQPGDSDSLAGHGYLALARLARRGGDDAVQPEDVTDLRRRGVATPTRGEFDQIAQDAFGAGYAVDGAPRLAFSLRAIVNAMLGDGRPAALGPRLLAPVAGGFPHLVFLPGGARRLFRIGPSGAPGVNALITQDIAPDGALSPPAVAFNLTGGLSVGGLNAVRQPDGAIWAIYQGSTGPGVDAILARRFFGGVWAGEITLSTGGANADPTATTDAAGVAHVAWIDRAGAGFVRTVTIPPGGGPAPTLDADPAPAAEIVLALAQDPEGGVRLVKTERTGPDQWTLRTKRRAGVGAWPGAFETVNDPLTSVGRPGVAAALAPSGDVALGFTVSPTATIFDLSSARLTPAAGGGFDLSDLRRHVRATAAVPADLPAQPAFSADADGNLRLVYRTQTQIRELALVYRV